MSFEEYTRTIDYIVTVRMSDRERIEAAYCAGAGRQAQAPGLISPSPYLFDQLREAFRLGQETR